MIKMFEKFQYFSSGQGILLPSAKTMAYTWGRFMGRERIKKKVTHWIRSVVVEHRGFLLCEIILC
jgi:hypothetical protein